MLKLTQGQVIEFVADVKEPLTVEPNDWLEPWILFICPILIRTLSFQIGLILLPFCFIRSRIHSFLQKSVRLIFLEIVTG